jgi:curved DNA-binding protein CbpA
MARSRHEGPGSGARYPDPFPQSASPYEILGVSPDTKRIDIRKRYLELARVLHPDRHGQSEESKRLTQQINDAYEKIKKGRARPDASSDQEQIRKTWGDIDELIREFKQHEEQRQRDAATRSRPGQSRDAAERQAEADAAYARSQAEKSGRPPDEEAASPEPPLEDERGPEAPMASSESANARYFEEVLNSEFPKPARPTRSFEDIRREYVAKKHAEDIAARRERRKTAKTESDEPGDVRTIDPATEREKVIETISSLRDALATHRVTPNEVRRLWARMDRQRDELLAEIAAYEAIDTEEKPRLARSILKKSSLFHGKLVDDVQRAIQLILSERPKEREEGYAPKSEKEEEDTLEREIADRLKPLGEDFRRARHEEYRPDWELRKSADGPPPEEAEGDATTAELRDRLGRLIKRFPAPESGAWSSREESLSEEADTADIPEPPDKPPPEEYGPAAPEPEPADAQQKPERVVHKNMVSLGAESAALLAAEHNVQKMDADFYRRSLMSRANQWLKGARGGDLAKKEREMDRAALALEQKFEQKLEGRLKEKDYGAIRESKEGNLGAPLRKQPDGTWAPGGARSSPEEFAKKVAERYRRAVIHKTVIARGEEARTRATEVVLASREQGIGEKALRSLGARAGAVNEAFEYNLGKEGARIARITLSALAGAGLMATFAPVSGVRIGMRIASAVIGAKLGEAAGAYAGQAYERTLGARARDRREKSKTDIADNIQQMAEKRKAFQKGDERTIEKKRKILEMLTAAGAGASFSLASLYATAESLPPTSETSPSISSPTPAEAARETPTTTSDTPPPLPRTEAGQAPQAAPPVPESSTVPSSPETPPAPRPEVPAPEASPAPAPAPQAETPAEPPLPGGEPLPPDAQPPPIREPEAPAVPAAPERVALVATVRPGYGAEAMMKDLWRQMHDANNHFRIPTSVDPSSDMARLYSAKPTEIDSLVHRLAIEHSMAERNNNLIVGKGSMMGFNESTGQIELSNTAKGAPLAEPGPRRAGPVPRTQGPTTADLNREELARIRAGQPPLPPSPTDRPTAPIGAPSSTLLPPDELIRPEGPTPASRGMLWSGTLYGEPAGPRAGGLVEAKASVVSVPHLVVEAGPGESYDGVIRHLWFELQGKKLNPNEYPVGSDIHRLLIADQNSIERIARFMAADQNHQFFGSAPPGTVLELGEDGNLHIAGAREAAPAGPPSSPPLIEEASPEPAPQMPPPVVAPEAAFDVAPSSSPVPVAEAVVSPPSFEHETVFNNHNGVEVDPAGGAVFVDSNGAVIAYGNDYANRLTAAEAYARAHKGVSVWVQAEYPIEVGGTWHQWAFPVTYRGMFRGLDIGLPAAGEAPPPSQMGTVNPETFMKKLS